MDPLTILPFEMREEIFSYLKFDDIIKASTVSKNWYQATANSKVCMSQIWIQNPDWEITKIDHILKSSRLYQNVFLFVRNIELKGNTAILRNMRSIINKFSGSLIDLTVNHDLQRTFELPKLSSLRFNGFKTHGQIVANGLLSKTKNLEKLTIKNFYLGMPSVKYLVNCLKEISSLKYMKIDDHRIIDLLVNEDVKFKLDKFCIDSLNNLERNYSISHFINLFRSSLTTICLPFNFQDVANLMSNFPHLKTMRFVKKYVFNQEQLPLQPNETIVFLALNPGFEGLIGEEFYINFNAIISNLEKLCLLDMPFINPRILNIIIACRTLKYISYSIVVGMTDRQLRRIGRASGKTLFRPD